MRRNENDLVLDFAASIDVTVSWSGDDYPKNLGLPLIIGNWKRKLAMVHFYNCEDFSAEFPTDYVRL